MRLPQFVINAFTIDDQPFTGNPAAVVPLDAWLPDATLQAVAEQNNLAETAFVVVHPNETGARPLRWFTPAREVRLCGHATLAAAAALGSVLQFPGEAFAFSTLSGVLKCRRGGGAIAMDFPADPAPLAPERLRVLAEAVVGRPLDPQAVREGRDDLFVALDDDAEVTEYELADGPIRAIDKRGVILSAASREGSGFDVVSRCFYPEFGIDEDPVTGSAHTLIGPYWSARLGKPTVACRQASRRGGDVRVTPLGEGRVSLSGRWSLFLAGEIEVA